MLWVIQTSLDEPWFYHSEVTLWNSNRSSQKPNRASGIMKAEGVDITGRFMGEFTGISG